MKQYLIAGVITSFLISSEAFAQSYDKDNEQAKMMHDTRRSDNLSESKSNVQNYSNVITPGKTGASTQYELSQKENPKFDPGFYLGGYGGHSWTDADIASETADVNGTDYGVFVGADLDVFLNGWMGLTGAIEGFYGWSEADDTATVAGLPIDIEKDHEWGINIRPGLTFIDKYAPFGIKPYGIIGYRRAEFNISSTTGSNDESFNGFELGVGTELVGYDSFGIRLDYSHVFYGEESGIDPDENDLRVGLAYHF